MCAKREEKEEKRDLDQSAERLFLTAQRRCSAVKNTTLLMKKVLKRSMIFILGCITFKLTMRPEKGNI